MSGLESLGSNNTAAQKTKREARQSWEIDADDVEKRHTAWYNAGSTLQERIEARGWEEVGYLHPPCGAGAAWVRNFDCLSLARCFFGEGRFRSRRLHLALKRHKPQRERTHTHTPDVELYREALAVSVLLLVRDASTAANIYARCCCWYKSTERANRKNKRRPDMSYCCSSPGSFMAGCWRPLFLAFSSSTPKLVHVYVLRIRS